MRDLKKESGITLIILIITVIVMVILAAVTIPIGIEQVKDSKNKKYISELEIVKQAIFEAHTLYNKTKNINVLKGEEASLSEVQTLASEMGVTLRNIPSGYDEAETKYYRIVGTDLDELGVQKSIHAYIVNYLTGEVLNETRVKTDDNIPLYTSGTFVEEVNIF